MDSSVRIHAPRTPEHDAIARAFQAAGAVSPAAARPLDAIPGAEASAVIALAARGVVREAAPGRYYLYQGTVHERRPRLVTAVLIGASGGAMLVGLPLLAWLLTR
jgi:hypothetical protein